MDDKVSTIYNSLNESERFGLQFGMFPLDKCKGFTREETIGLMTWGKQNGYK